MILKGCSLPQTSGCSEEASRLLNAAAREPDSRRLSWRCLKTPLRGAYAWWLFNQCNPAGETQEGPENCHLFLLVDTVGKGAWMTLGYGLEPFIGERHLRQFLEGARPHFSRGEYAAGAALVIREAGRMIQEMAAALPRIFGLPREATESRSVGVR